MHKEDEYTCINAWRGVRASPLRRGLGSAHLTGPRGAGTNHCMVPKPSPKYQVFLFPYNLEGNIVLNIQLDLFDNFRY